MTRCVVQTIQEMGMSVLLSCYSEQMGSVGLCDATYSLIIVLSDCQRRTLHLKPGDLWYEEKASRANVEPMFQTCVKWSSGLSFPGSKTFCDVRHHLVMSHIKQSIISIDTSTFYTISTYLDLQESLDSWELQFQRSEFVSITASQQTNKCSGMTSGSWMHETHLLNKWFL